MGTQWKAAPAKEYGKQLALGVSPTEANISGLFVADHKECQQKYSYTTILNANV